MAHDHEALATAAKERLCAHIHVCASQLVSELIKNAEDFGEWQDELYRSVSIEGVAENQYRILVGGYGSGFDSSVRVVKVESVDQDDLEADEYTEFSFSAFAQWLWNRMTEAAQADWCERAKAPNFDPGLEEHQEMLFADQDAHPATTSGLLPYLKEQESWLHATLLDEGDEPEMVDQEVYEHWIVSKDAKRDLRSAGERVVEIMNLNIWCRTCTGQSFWYDSCMQQLGARYLNQ